MLIVAALTLPDAADLVGRLAPRPGLRVLRETGGRVVFQRIVADQDEGLWAIDGRGRLSQVTKRPVEGPLDCSPDGRWVAGTDEQGVVVVDVGSGPVVAHVARASRPGWPSWSPDGASLVVEMVEDRGACLGIASVEGAEATGGTSSPRPIPGTDGLMAPDWSHANGRIAAVGVNGLWTLRPDGSDKRCLSESWPGFELTSAGPSWSPDGKSIVLFAGIGGRFATFRCSSEGGAPEVLCPFPLSGRPAWSADGRYLVLGQRGLWLYEVETGRRLRLTAGGRALALDGNLEEDPCWLPYPL